MNKKTICVVLTALLLSVLLVFGACTKKAEKSEFDIELNDEYADARLIKAGDTVKGEFKSEDDIFYYKVVLNEAGYFSAWTESKIDMYNLEIVFFDEDGDWDDYISGDYTNGRSGDMRVEGNLYPGTYVVELEAYDEGPFTLKTKFEKKTAGSASSSASQYSPSSNTSPSLPGSSSPGGNWDSLINEYERLINDYAILLQRVSDGDYSVIDAMVQLEERIDVLDEMLEDAEDYMSEAQFDRFMRVQDSLYDLF